MAIKIYCDRANEYRCIRHMIECSSLNPNFRDANSYKEKFNLEEDILPIEYDVKEFTERSVLELNDNDLTFFKMCIYTMRDRLKTDIKNCKSILKDLEYSGLSNEISVYKGMINMDEKIIMQCSDWLKRLEQL